MYGYGIEFDGTGRYDDYRIDYQALAAHLLALDTAARANGIGIGRVIFDPQRVPYLYQTRLADAVRARIQIPLKPSWVRHDEHYHLDFVVKCRSMTRAGSP